MCSSDLFGSPKLAARYKKGFPRSLEGAPLLLPMEGTLLRRSLDQWFVSKEIRPLVAGEFKDSALLKTFGEAGTGLVAAPMAIEKEVRKHYGVGLVGTLDGVSESYYAISIERRLKNPAVVAISDAAKGGLFSRNTSKKTN